MCTVAAKLHNYCINEGETESAPQHPRNIMDGDVCEVVDNNDAGDDDVVSALRARG